MVYRDTRVATGTNNKSAPARRARGSLSPEQILDEARRIVERDGLRQLSMPVLAKHLRSGVTSIYWYFRSKDELVEALTDRVFREMYKGLPPIGDRAWDEEMFDYFLAFRDLIDETPVYREVFVHRLRLFFGRSAVAPSVLRRLEDGLAVLVHAGLAPEQAVGAYIALTNYACGFVILEHGFAAQDGPDEPVNNLASLAPDDFPILSRLGDVAAVIAIDDNHFRLGLRLVLEGIATEYGLPTSAELGG